MKYTIYALTLSDGKYYIGSTTNLKGRYEAHLYGKGANYTKKHKPIKISYRKTYDCSRSTAIILENYLTLEYAKKYGDNNVVGGSYLTESRVKKQRLIK